MATLRCLYAQTNVLGRIFCLCIPFTKICLFQAYSVPVTVYKSNLELEVKRHWGNWKKNGRADCECHL